MDKPIYWYQGLFLQPQHLQLQDRHNQGLFAPYQKNIHPFLWGTGNVKIREAEIPNNAIHIDQGVFWFPGGTYACLHENAGIEPRRFSDDLVTDGRPVTVFAGIRKFNAHEPNVTPLAAGAGQFDANTRYITSIEPEEIGDVHGGGAPAQVKKLDLLVKIFFDNELDRLGDYELIPVMQLERSGEDIIVNRRYIPPSFSLQHSAQLRESASDIISQLMSRGGELESHKKDRGVHNAEFGSRDMVYLLALRSLNRYIPVMDHLITARVHPWQFYGVIRQLVGELSTFSRDISVLGIRDDDNRLLPDYDHENLGECYARASRLVARLLDEITAGPKYMIALVYDDTYYSARLEPGYFGGTNRYYVAVQTQDDPDRTMESIAVSLKTGPASIMPMLISKSLPGVDLTHLPNPPQELPRRANTYYFRLDHHSDIWAKIKDENNISIYWEGAPADVKMEMMIIG